MPHRRIWRILLHDKTALTEVLSGLLLVGLRGALLLGKAQMFSLSSDVAQVLRQIGVTEDRWGTFLMICGVVQIFLARTGYTIGRVLVTSAILAGFVVMGAGFYQVNGWGSIPPSIVCMSCLYAYLLMRIGADHRHPERPGADDGS
jgi:hypothetical protein